MNSGNNILFATFLGYNTKGYWWNNGDGGFLKNEDCKFGTSYDWIIPVIQTIISFDLSTFNYDLSAMTIARQMIEKISKLSVYTSIAELNEHALEFITWYNKQQPKK